MKSVLALILTLAAGSAQAHAAHGAHSHSVELLAGIFAGLIAAAFFHAIGWLK